jgi:hypothetical protein
VVVQDAEHAVNRRHQHHLGGHVLVDGARRHGEIEGHPRRRRRLLRHAAGEARRARQARCPPQRGRQHRSTIELELVSREIVNVYRAAQKSLRAALSHASAELSFLTSVTPELS